MLEITDRPPAPMESIVASSEVANMPEALATMQACVLRSRNVSYASLNGETLAVWGLIPPTLLSTSAWVWLLTTRIAAEHKFLVVRYSQRWVEDALRLYDRLEGVVMVGNDSAVRWLRWLGAEFGEPIGRGMPFVIRRRGHG